MMGGRKACTRAGFDSPHGLQNSKINTAMRTSEKFNSLKAFMASANFKYSSLKGGVFLDVVRESPELFNVFLRHPAKLSTTNITIDISNESNNSRSGINAAYSILVNFIREAQMGIVPPSGFLGNAYHGYSLTRGDAELHISHDGHVIGPNWRFKAEYIRDAFDMAFKCKVANSQAFPENLYMGDNSMELFSPDMCKNWEDVSFVSKDGDLIVGVFRIKHTQINSIAKALGWA